MWLLVGLGNPGKQYAQQRHNIGFMAVDAIAAQHRAGAWNNKFKSEVAEIAWGDEKILLLKPQTYMNLSGEAVAAAAGFYKILPEQICVIHDELDLPLGDVRLKQGGSAGGHNGLKSIDSHMGQDYLRLRIGIGHPRNLGLAWEASDFVLSNFVAAEREELTPLLDYIARHLKEEIERFQAQGAKQMRINFPT